MSKRREESPADIRQHVEGARARQIRRYGETASLWFNADLGSLEAVQQACLLAPSAEKLLRVALQQLQFTPRQVMTVQRLALTIADLAGSEHIEANHIAEAIQYRTRL